MYFSAKSGMYKKENCGKTKSERVKTAKGRTTGSRAKPAVEAKEVKRRQRALEKELERDAGAGARSDLYQSADRSRIR